MNRPGADLPAGLLAAAAAGAAAALLCGGQVVAATAVHLLAAHCARRAASRRPGASATDRRLVVTLALFAPPLGAVYSWMLPPGPGGRGHDAHRAFEEGETASLGSIDWSERVAAAEVAEAPLPLSFDEILRHGSIVHRRNALRRLAQLGEPRHLRLLRRALQHSDPELRLAAFAELDRVGRGHEDRIEAQRRRVAAVLAEHDERHDSAQRELARLASLHSTFAESGLLDQAMSNYHRGCAARHGALLSQRPDAALPVRVARYGAWIAEGRAAQVLDELRYRPPEPELLEIRARALWELREFDELSRLAARVISCGDAHRLPTWVRDFHAAAGRPTLDVVEPSGGAS